MERLRILFGLGLVIGILGSGVLMSLYLLKVQSLQISPAEWQNLQTTVAELAAMHASSTPVLSSVTASPSLVERLPINSADQIALETLPGIGPARAKAMFEARANGPFRDLDDLHARVPNIPSSVLDEISSKITFE